MHRTWVFCYLILATRMVFGQTPVIESFSVDSPIINVGDTATLSWEVTNFDSLAINGAAVENGEVEILVSPLVTTIYTLSATNTAGSSSAQVTVAVQDAPGLIPARGRFIELVKNTPSNTRLHISEIEAFAPGETPDEVDPDGTSQNDLVQAGSSSTEYPPTTTSIAWSGHFGL